jgi:hypothetical protein
MEESQVICLGVTCTTLYDVRGNRNCCPPDLRSQAIHLFSRKPCGDLIDEQGYLVSHLERPKFSVISHN